MYRNLSALFAGILFGLGLVVSQMVNPAKVIGFLDLFGAWDPSLAFVMGGALIVTGIGYRLVTKKEQPMFDENFHIPADRTIDTRLVIGSVLFGAGWGLVGLCPGPAISALSIGGLPIIVFLVSMGAGGFLFEKLNSSIQPPTDSMTGHDSAQSA
jgi:uncharacterized membrane protein YedE/YeeE